MLVKSSSVTLLTKLHCDHGPWLIVMELFCLCTAPPTWLGLLRPALTYVLSWTGWKLLYKFVMQPHVHVLPNTTNGWCQPLHKTSLSKLPVSETDFCAPKRLNVNSASATVHNVATPLQTEKEDSLREVAKEQGKSRWCYQSSDHLSKLLHGIFKPEHLDRNYIVYTQLLTLAENSPQERVTPAMEDNLDQMTCHQLKSKHWFWFTAGRFIASWFKQVIRKDLHQPYMLSLTSVCYPDVYM